MAQTSVLDVCDAWHVPLGCGEGRAYSCTTSAALVADMPNSGSGLIKKLVATLLAGIPDHVWPIGEIPAFNAKAAEVT